MTMRDEIAYAISESKGVTFETPEARTAFVDSLMASIAEAWFGEGAKVGNPQSPARSLADLYDRCSEYTEGTCPVQALNVTGEAVELGPASYLAWEELPAGETRAVLGYDLPDVDRYYYHHFPAETKVFVLTNGSLVITHPDLLLTTGGLDEGDEARVPIPEDNDDWQDEPATTVTVHAYLDESGDVEIFLGKPGSVEGNSISEGEYGGPDDQYLCCSEAGVPGGADTIQSLQEQFDTADGEEGWYSVQVYVEATEE